jgi:hypothetical protein
MAAAAIATRDATKRRPRGQMPRLCPRRCPPFASSSRLGGGGGGPGALPVPRAVRPPVPPPIHRSEPERTRPAPVFSLAMTELWRGVYQCLWRFREAMLPFYACTAVANFPWGKSGALRRGEGSWKDGVGRQLPGSFRSRDRRRARPWARACPVYTFHDRTTMIRWPFNQALKLHTLYIELLTTNTTFE